MSDNRFIRHPCFRRAQDPNGHVAASEHLGGDVLAGPG